MYVYVCVIFRPLHIAVAQGEEAVVHKLIFIMKAARKHLNIYNHLRQVRQLFFSGPFGSTQRNLNVRSDEHLKLFG